MAESLGNGRNVLKTPENRDFQAYHAFLRSCRNFMEGPVVRQMAEFLKITSAKVPRRKQ